MAPHCSRLLPMGGSGPQKAQEGEFQREGP